MVKTDYALNPKDARPRPHPWPLVGSVTGGVSELEMLQRRVEYLEAENAYLKALRDLMNNES